MGTRGGVAWPCVTLSREGPMGQTCTWAGLRGGERLQGHLCCVMWDSEGGRGERERGATAPSGASLWGNTAWGAEPTLGAPDLQHCIVPG